MFQLSTCDFLLAIYSNYVVTSCTISDICRDILIDSRNFSHTTCI